MKPSRELKGAELTKNQKLEFANRTNNLLEKHSEIEICSITVAKENVQLHIREDANKLYNYMINLCLLEEIEHLPLVRFTPAPRSIKVTSGDSMVDYLQMQLWFERQSRTILRLTPHESHANNNLQFAGILANIVWGNFEKGESDAFEILAPRMRSRRLFFR